VVTLIVFPDVSRFLDLGSRASQAETGREVLREGSVNPVHPLIMQLQVQLIRGWWLIMDTLRAYKNSQRGDNFTDSGAFCYAKEQECFMSLHAMHFCFYWFYSTSFSPKTAKSCNKIH